MVTGFPCALLEGVINPADGMLYLCGFRIWGTALEQITDGASTNTESAELVHKIRRTYQ